MPSLWIPPSEEMVMNLDPSVSSSLALDPLVTHIDDLSGNDHGAIAGTKPSLSTLNGLGAIAFTAKQYLNIEGGGISYNTKMTIFSVFERASVGIVSVPAGSYHSSYPGLNPFHWRTTNYGYTQFGSTTVMLGESTATGSFLITTIIDGLYIAVRKNGLLWNFNPSAGTVGPTPMNAIGRAGWDAYWHNGLVGQVIACNSIVDYVKYEGYLAHKWGVTLDATHKYFDSPPYDPFWTNFKGQSEV